MEDNRDVKAEVTIYYTHPDIHSLRMISTNYHFLSDPEIKKDID